MLEVSETQTISIVEFSRNDKDPKRIRQQQQQKEWKKYWRKNWNKKRTAWYYVVPSKWSLWFLCARKILVLLRVVFFFIAFLLFVSFFPICMHQLRQLSRSMWTNHVLRNGYSFSSNRKRCDIVNEFYFIYFFLLFWEKTS